MNEESKLIELFKNTPELLHAYGGVLQFYSLQGIKEYFEIVHIETQELTPTGFKTAILDQ